MEFELQPLRIPGGWTIELNHFCECDPDPIVCLPFWAYFNEDLLRLRNKEYELLIDLGWYPDGDVNGSFKLFLFYDYNLREPLEVFETKDRLEVIKRVEYWTNYGFFQKYI